jgi:rhodanese-related sulfurtransferase
MSLLNIIQNLFGNNADTNVQDLPENNTQHPNPIFDNLNGHLFKKALTSNPNAVLLDVRTSMEVRSGALPGAINIDFMSSNFMQKVAGLDKSKTYLVYCRSGNRSGQACQMMHKMGFDVRNLMGGIGAFPQK